MPSQKALVLQTRSGRLAVTTFPIPKPGPGEVLLKVHSASLNPVDVAIKKTGIFVNYYPAILGSDLAGEVVSRGAGVTTVVPGDKIFSQGSFSNSYAGFQQYALADINTLAKIPPSMTYDQAATMPLVCTTAFLALYNDVPHGLGLDSPLRSPGHYTGSAFLVVGGSSSVGQYAIQFAKASGFGPIITTASPRHEPHLLSIGATHVLDRNQSLGSLKERVQGILGTEKQLSYVVDAISRTDTQHIAMTLVAPGGRLVTVREPVFKDGYKEKSISTVMALKGLPQNVGLMRELWANMTKLLEDAIIQPLRYEVISGGLDGVSVGMKRMEEQKVSGVKLVVHPQETASSYT
ncbi:chaperonin 10-like protein [Ephemerocybe angulata]|uniref:Chaperonin 10-like protein n=1 Tax=Ephemerocybe angulata TaxID=980116 RepID=A0A8H6IHF5_9AGAR|nr:chaperonin 10-like protein [Tulosesus angulatus]